MNNKWKTFTRGWKSLFLVLSLVLVAAVTANPQGSARVDADYYSDHHHHQHGSGAGHLPETTLNVELVGKLKVTSFEGDIADVTALQSASDGKWYAYLSDWGAKCETGGVHVVDISDPANPVKLGFLNAGGTAYQTEGVHALHIETSAFTGDILVASNEWCLAKANPKLNPGGITLWDITDPTDIKLLVDGFGDFDLHGSRANEAHSAIAWNAGDKAYVAVIDNEENLDVDLVEITDPSNPVLLSETGLPEWPDAETHANGQLSFAHDYDVIQKPDGKWHLMVSYWDTGWVDLDVTDPSNPVFIEDFTYAACDPVVPTACPPEGNGHQGEWNAAGTLFLGTDEDFDPYRTTPLTRTTGSGAPETYSTVPVGGAPITVLPDLRLNGPVVYGGYGCPGASKPIPQADSIIPPGSLDPGEEQIIVLQRGPGGDDPNNPEPACFPGEKADNATDQGWDAVILTGRHLAGGAAADEPPNCGFGAFPADEQIPAVCTTHTAMHELFNRIPDFTLPYPLGDPGDREPNIGEVGLEVDLASVFDGWGYVRLIDADPTGGFTEIDQLTIPQTADPAFALGFGDITVHEVEVPRGDPNEGGSHPDDGRLAYFSWYSGGFRVAEYNSTGITEVGRYIDPEGNNFWGVALAEDPNGDRIILASDRDYGLFIFRYTGP
jgi:hypothetical protein